MFHSTTIDGSAFELYYQDVGEGPPVVFLHGFGGNHLSWYKQASAFSPEYRCIAPDQRRFGRSTDPTGVGLEAHADDLLALVDELGLDRVALVGQSMGGWPVASFATQHPDRVAGLVLSATTGGLLGRERHHELMADGDDATDPDPLAPEEEFLTDAISALNTDAPDEWADAREVLDELPLDAEVVADLPVLAITGAADEFVPAPVRDALATALDAETVAVDGAGHSVYFERPEAFNDHLRSFLEDRATF